MTTTAITASVTPKVASNGLEAQPAAGEPELSKSEQKAIAKEESKYSEFVVLLDDQGTRAVEKAFEMPVGPERRQYVAKTLIENMVKTQAPLWKTLDGLQAAGHVSERRGYTPLWIQNAIVVYGDETAMTTMAHAAGVSQALKSATHVLDRPGEYVDQLAPIEDAVNGAGEALADLPIDVEQAAAAKAAAGGPTGKKPDLSQDPQWNLTRVGIDKAHKDGLTGKGVTVGIIDTGLDVEHPFLLSKYRGYDADSGSRTDLTNWFDSVSSGRSSTPVDEGGHGTHVAGTIVGEYGGVAIGGAPDAKIVAARGLGPQGGSDGMLLSSFQNMVAPRVPTPGTSPGSRRVIALGPDIINNSWGSDDGTSVGYMHALRNMDAMGVINVMAAGNDGGGAGTIGSPASSPHIITVGATDRNDNPASFSSRGPNPLPVEGGDPVPFVAAPGTEIRSSIPGGELEAGWQGTSMAAPLVSSIIALAQQAAVEETGRKFDTRAMKQVLKLAAQDVSEKGPDDATGYGIPVADDLRKHVKAVAKELGLIEPAPAKNSAKS
jgi:subtilisin family serine protease